MTSWQDYTLAICVLAYNIALIPSVVGAQKPRLATSLMTALFLIPQAIVFFSLGLWFSLAMTLTNFALWTTLFLQVSLKRTGN